MNTQPLECDGLDGTNPMGFLAGLGLLAVLNDCGHDPRLWWSDGIVPRARLAGMSSIERVIDEVIRDKEVIAEASLLRFPPEAPAADVKFAPDEVAKFLEACRGSEPSSALSAALVCEHVVDNNGKAKPTDLHFTAGKQRFLESVAELQAHVTADHLEEAIVGPWAYGAKLKSFMWDSADDRDYALAATKPADTTKMTVPGADWLAFRGLALLSVLAGKGRTLTPGCGGTWKSGFFTWSLWDVPLTADVTRTVIQAIEPRDGLPDQAQQNTWLAWGVHTVLRSRITRSDQGGYGTFRPPERVWSRQATDTDLAKQDAA